MIRLLALFVALCASPAAWAQGPTQSPSFRLKIVDATSGRALPGANVSVRNTGITATSDQEGRVSLVAIPDGEHALEIHAEGFEIQELILNFPVTDPLELVVQMKLNEVGEVTVSITRTGRDIDDVPTRVEAIDEEEVDEKINMRPANVSMLLNESTGIRVQQTSATSYTQSVRIQGLDGRYSQILKDGFPAFGGFSGSLGLLDIPPLDLKQVEIVKGAASTFYGGGAIAGVVNFLSKEPGEEQVADLILNQTSALGTDVSFFGARKFKRVGYTLFGAANYQNEYDADGDHFTDLPETYSFGFSPRFFFYPNDKTRVIVGHALTSQERYGGDIFVVRGQQDSEHRYFELNHTRRNITTIQLGRDLTNGRRLLAKQSVAFFERSIAAPDYLFTGGQFNSYTDISYFHPAGKHALVVGFNVVYDRFRERTNPSNPLARNETRAIAGGYIQDTFEVTEKFLVDAGFRLDTVRDYGVFPLPRVSVLYRFDQSWSSRISYGLGYKPPSIFTEDAEQILFKNVLPIGNGLRAEESQGGTFDVNYRHVFGERLEFSFNQMFFQTQIRHPLVLNQEARGSYRFSNASQRIRTRGAESNLRIAYGILRLFGGFTYTHAKAGYLTGNQFLPLTPKGKLNSAILLEKENAYKLGFEAYYTSSQFLDDGTRTRAFWVLGVFGEKNFGKFSLFINGENITDTRQTKFGPVVLPPFQNPTFADIYAPTEGRVFNGGIKVRF